MNGSVHLNRLLPILLIVAGIAFRIDDALGRTLWADEAESAINGLAILEHGLPIGEFLGEPVYENVMVKPWPENVEYEFRDVSYSENGLSIYHGWLPLYAIALSEKAFGLDKLTEATDGAGLPFEIDSRTWAPRIPALIASLIFLVLIYKTSCELSNSAAGLAALTVAALGSQCISFGAQARYYSFALMFTAAGVLLLWRCLQRGGLRDFVLLGCIAGLLFHTHKICCLAFLATSAGALFFGRRRLESVVPRSLAALSVFSVAVVPWVVSVGFLENGSSLPFAVWDLEWPADGVIYIAQRPIASALFLVGLAAMGVPQAAWRRLAVGGDPLSPRMRAAVLLTSWSVISYVAFFALMPSASFWFSRLTLVIAVPAILLFGMAIDAIGEQLRVGHRPVFAVLCSLAFLGVTGRLGASGATSSLSFSDLNQGAELLSQCRLPDSKLYATPNEHLVWAYYLRQPVVSVAAVRREFIEQYPGQIVLIDRATLLRNPIQPADIRAASLRAGVEIPEDEIEHWIYLIGLTAVRRQRAQEVAEAHLDGSLPDYFKPLLEQVEEFLVHPYPLPGFRLENPAMIREMPLTEREWWQAFFLKYVDPESRSGERANYSRRFRQAAMIALGESPVVVYFSPPPCEPSGDEECPPGCRL